MKFRRHVTIIKYKSSFLTSAAHKLRWHIGQYTLQVVANRELYKHNSSSINQIEYTQPKQTDHEDGMLKPLPKWGARVIISRF